MNAFDQAKNFIERSQNILIFPTQDIQGDSFGSTLALFNTLKKIGKNAKIIIEEIPERFQFLINLNEFVISIDTSTAQVTEMRYEKNEKDLKIYLSFSQGKITEKNISFQENSQQFGNLQKLETKPDLLITLGAENLESLGKPFSQNPKIFYEIPILNIDIQLSNQNYGELNLIEIKACSLAEVITNLIKSINEEIFDKNIASFLLTGILWSSQNFKNPRIRPQTFETVSYLIEKGADYQKITHHLYRQKSISQVKLLGRVLENLSFDEKKEIYSTILTDRDFQELESSPKDLSFVVEELKFNLYRLPNLLLLFESRSSPLLIKGVFYSSRSDFIEKILENFEGKSKGNGVMFLVKEKNLETAKEKVLNIL